MQLTKGQKAPLFISEDIWGNKIDLSTVEHKKVLITFLRYSECAICQLRISEIMREKQRFLNYQIHVIAIFQSPAESLIQHIVKKTMFDFTLIADPNRSLYKLYNVEPSWAKLLKTISLDGINRIRDVLKNGFKPGGKVEGYFHQIPADFIIDKNKTILLAKYGESAIDHIPLDQILKRI